MWLPLAILKTRATDDDNEPLVLSKSSSYKKQNQLLKYLCLHCYISFKTRKSEQIQNNTIHDCKGNKLKIDVQ